MQTLSRIMPTDCPVLKKCVSVLHTLHHAQYVLQETCCWTDQLIKTPHIVMQQRSLLTCSQRILRQWL